MYVCLECGLTFDEPDYWEETHGLRSGPYEHWSGCPNCHGAYTETYKCACCNEWIDGTYIKTNDGNRICEHCCITYEIGEED